MDFGEVPLGLSGTETLTLTNTGGGTLEILSVSLVEGDDDLFDVDSSGADAVETDGVGTVTLTFTPEAEGTETGQIQIRSNAANGEIVYVDLSASGTPSTLDGDGDGYSPADGDCDDGDASASPAGDEVCDGVDNDCDGRVPSDEADADYDGARVCEDDCDDGDPLVYPGADEICDDKDSDCDGAETDREDQDGDGYAVCDGDCDDTDRLATPTGTEICDGADNDCSGEPDDLDLDDDGHSPCGAAGDCDDTDASAYPVVVDPDAADGGDGTDLLPFNDLGDALENLDEICHTVLLAPGSYAVAVAWSDGDLTLQGTGDSAGDVVLSPDEAGAHILEVTGGGEVTLQDLTVSSGAADGDGGALWASFSDLTLTRVTATSNQSSGDGGAVAVNGGTLTLADCTFVGNTATDDGGALSVVTGSLVDLGSTYEDNAAVRGGALVAEGGFVDIDGSVYQSNTATEEGGAITLSAVDGLSVLRSSFASNVAGTRGGALSLRDVDDSGGDLRNNLVQDNAAGSVGGGIAITGDATTFTLANNTLTGNTSDDEGGGLYVEADDGSGLVIWSNLVIASFGASGLYVVDGTGASVRWNTSYLTSSGVEFGGEVSAGSDENTEENPLFTDFSNDGDPTNDDLSLRSSSPARNSGPDSADWDDLDGTQNDRGATGGPEATP